LTQNPAGLQPHVGEPVLSQSKGFRPPAPSSELEGNGMPGKKASSKKGTGRNSEERIVHEFHIISEGLASQVKQVAEGVANVDEKLDRSQQELKAEIEEKTQPIVQAVVSLDRKLDRIHRELKDEIQETRQEILAAVKFSYAELDKRLTTLEKEFLELRLRVEKIESRPVS
jgi:phosphoenolpyruvate-protein kinase (PTS system EI component)